MVKLRLIIYLLSSRCSKMSFRTTFSRCYLCRPLSRAISSPVVLIVVGKQGIRQMVDSWWSETKEKVYCYRITSDPFLVLQFFKQEQRNSLFLKKDCNRPIFKILIMTNTRCDVIRHLIKKSLIFSVFKRAFTELFYFDQFLLSRMIKKTTI